MYYNFLMRRTAHRKKFSVILLLCLAFFAFPPLASAGDYIIVTADLPPWSINGKTGIFPDIIAEIEKKIGRGHYPVELPWSRAQAYAEENNNYLIFPLTRTPDREDSFTWIAEVMPYKMLFVTLGGEPVDLDKARRLKSIGVHMDAPPYLYLYKRGFDNLYSMPYGNGPLARMLSAGRVDAWFTDPNFARYIFKGTAYEDRLVFGPPLSDQVLYIAGSLNLSQDIVEAYRKAFEELKADGTVQRIMDKYLSD